MKDFIVENWYFIILVIPFILVFIIHFLCIIYCKGLGKLNKFLNKHSGLFEDDFEKINDFKEFVKDLTKKEIIDYKLEFDKSISEIKWKSFIIFGSMLAIITLGIKYFNILLDNKGRTEDINTFYNIIGLAIAFSTISIFYFAFMYIAHENKRLKLLKKIVSSN